MKRMAQGAHTTLSQLYVEDLFVCYILEDSLRRVKVKHRTAIPAGTYRLGLNPWAGMNTRYGPLMKGRHEGMVEVLGIPNFSMVFFHIGNYHTDTSGCLLTGSYYQMVDGDYRVLHSAAAYRELYPKLVERIQEGDTCLEITELESLHYKEEKLNLKNIKK